MKYIPLIPGIFFAVSIYFRFRDNSYNLIQENTVLDRKYVWAIPLKELHKILADTPDEKDWKREVRKAIRSRKLHYFFFLLCFVSVFVVGYVYRTFGL